MAGHAPVEQVRVRDGHAVGVAVRDGRRLAEIGTSRVVLSAGAYGSPAILLRSGIGPADELIAIGVKPVLDLPGVGRNLHDQPCLEVGYEGSGDLIEAMERHRAETGWRPDEQVIAKFPSAGCRQGFDLHIYPVSGQIKDASQWSWTLGVACLTPLSRGSVRLTGPGLDDQLVIDHRYLSDPGGYDRARFAAASDPDSVVDSEGQVHGIEGLYVADASLMPAVTSNTNMPTAVIGERITRSLLGLAQPTRA